AFASTNHRVTKPTALAPARANQSRTKREKPPNVCHISSRRPPPPTHAALAPGQRAVHPGEEKSAVDLAHPAPSPCATAGAGGAGADPRPRTSKGHRGPAYPDQLHRVCRGRRGRAGDSAQFGVRGTER